MPIPGNETLNPMERNNVDVQGLGSKGAIGIIFALLNFGVLTNMVFFLFFVCLWIGVLGSPPTRPLGLDLQLTCLLFYSKVNKLHVSVDLNGSIVKK